MMRKKLLYIVLGCLFIAGCRTIDPITPPEEEKKGEAVQNEIVGFYLLNEGNMGSNKSTLDYYDYTTATYSRDIYAEANPNVPKELGDVGNDLKITVVACMLLSTVRTRLKCSMPVRASA